MTLLSFEHSETPEQKADRLLKLAMSLDQQAREALEAAEAAFRRIGRPLPLFPHLDREGR